MRITSRFLLSAAAILAAVPASAAWQPQKTIEFVATAGPGGGTDNLARAVQGIITKYKLTDQSVHARKRVARRPILRSRMHELCTSGSVGGPGQQRQRRTRKGELWT